MCILISQQTRLMKMFIMRKPNMTTYFVELVMTQILGDDVQKCLEFSPLGDQTQRIYTPMDQIQRIYSHGHNPVFQLLWTQFRYSTPSDPIKIMNSHGPDPKNRLLWILINYTSVIPIKIIYSHGTYPNNLSQGSNSNTNNLLLLT